MMLKKFFLITALLFVPNLLFNDVAVAQIYSLSLPPISDDIIPSRLIFKRPTIREFGNRSSQPHYPICGKGTTALLPNLKELVDYTKMPVELTSSSRPTFVILVSPSSHKQAIFVLRTEDSELILREEIKLNQDTEIIAYSLPDNFPGLEVGKKYLWRFSQVCHPNDYSSNTSIFGWVKRVNLSTQVAEQLSKAKTAREKARIYANHGYWFDTLKTILDLRINEPENLSVVDDWMSLMQSVNLPLLINQPIIPVTGVQEKPPSTE